jgi:ArsR family transcriptional regulator
MNNDMKTTLKIFKAISDKNRLRIIKMLEHKSGSCVCEICEVLGVSQSTTSSHLKILEDADIIYSSKDGKWVNYYLNRQFENKKIEEINSLISTWLDNDNQINSDKERLNQIDRNILCQ